MKADRCLYFVTRWVKKWVRRHIVPLTNRLTREKKREAKWLAGALERKWELLPSAEVGKISLGSDIVVTRWGEAHAKTPGKERRKYLGQEDKEPYFQAELQKLNKCRQPENKEKKREKEKCSPKESRLKISRL